MASFSSLVLIFSFIPMGTAPLYAWSEKDLAKKESLCRQAAENERQAGEKRKEAEAYRKKAKGFRGEATSAQEALEGKINEYNKKKRELDKLNTEAEELDKQITQMQEYGNAYVEDTSRVADPNVDANVDLNADANKYRINLIQKARATNYTPIFIWACQMRECLKGKNDCPEENFPKVPQTCQGMEKLGKAYLGGDPAMAKSAPFVDPVDGAGWLGKQIKPKGKDLKEPWEPINLEDLGKKIRQNKNVRENIKAEMDKIAKKDVPPLIKKNKDNVEAAEGAMNDAAKAQEEAQNKSRVALRLEAQAYALTNTDCGVNPPDYSAEAKALEEETEALLDIVQDELKKFKAL